MKLVVEHVAGARRGQRQVFEPEARVRFGRHPDNEVAFDPHGDRDASTHHAEIVHEGGPPALVDLGSANGTFVGGARVSRVVLAPGVSTIVEFGAGGPTCRITLGDPATLVPATVHQTGGRRPVGRGTGATGIRQAVDLVLARQGKRTRTALVAIAAAGVVVTAGVIVWSARGQETRRAEGERLRRDVEEARRDAELRRAADEDARRTRDRLLAEGPGPAIVREHRDVVYLLASVEPDGVTATPFCTAFAVAPMTLATNAHCVRALHRLRGEGRSAFAIASGGGRRVMLADAAAHPDYVERSDAPSWDVGTITVAEPLPRAARLATGEAARTLSAGARIFTYGFPARLADAARPEATLTEGVIGRVTTLAGAPGTPASAILVQHSAFTTGGTSGSPVFDAGGAVVAVNAGGVRTAETRVVRDPQTGQDSVVDVGTALPGYNVAIRIDVLEPLMKDLRAP